MNSSTAIAHLSAAGLLHTKTASAESRLEKRHAHIAELLQKHDIKKPSEEDVAELHEVIQNIKKRNLGRRVLTYGGMGGLTGALNGAMVGGRSGGARGALIGAGIGTAGGVLSGGAAGVLHHLLERGSDRSNAARAYALGANS